MLPDPAADFNRIELAFLTEVWRAKLEAEGCIIDPSFTQLICPKAFPSEKQYPRSIPTYLLRK